MRARRRAGHQAAGGPRAGVALHVLRRLGESVDGTAATQIAADITAVAIGELEVLEQLVDAGDQVDAGDLGDGGALREVVAR